MPLFNLTIQKNSADYEVDALLLVVRMRDSNRLEEHLRDREIGVNLRAPHGSAMARLCSEKLPDLPTIEFLLSHGGCISEATYGASAGGHIELAQRFIKVGGCITLAAKGAFIAGKIDFAKSLIAKGASPGKALVGLAILLHTDKSKEQIFLAELPQIRASEYKAALLGLAGNHHSLQSLIAEKPTLKLTTLAYFAGAYQCGNPDQLGRYIQDEAQLANQLMGACMEGDHESSEAILSIHSNWLHLAIEITAQTGNYQQLWRFTGRYSQDKQDEALLLVIKGALQVHDTRLLSYLQKKYTLPLSRLVYLAIEKNDPVVVLQYLLAIEGRNAQSMLSYRQPSTQNTMLHLAAQKNEYALVVSLLQYCIPLGIKNSAGQLAIELAPKTSTIEDLLKNEMRSYLCALELWKGTDTLTDSEVQGIVFLREKLTSTAQGKTELASHRKALLEHYHTVRQVFHAGMRLPYDIQSLFYFTQAPGYLETIYHPRTCALLHTALLPESGNSPYLERVKSRINGDVRYGRFYSGRQLEQPPLRERENQQVMKV